MVLVIVFSIIVIIGHWNWNSEFSKAEQELDEHLEQREFKEEQ